MNVISLSSSWLDIFSKAANEGDIASLEKLRNLGVLHADLAGDCINRIETADLDKSCTFIADIAIAHKDHAAAALEILANVFIHSAPDDIARIANTHKEFIPQAFEILGRYDHPYMANHIGQLGRTNPEWALLAFDNLKIMTNMSAPHEIAAIVKLHPEFAVEGIKALEFVGVMGAAALIDDIARETGLYFKQALASISKIRDKFAEHAQSTDDQLSQAIADQLDERAGKLTQLSRQP